MSKPLNEEIFLNLKGLAEEKMKFSSSFRLLETFRSDKRKNGKNFK